jgi:hypothetical protein
MGISNRRRAADRDDTGAEEERWSRVQEGSLAHESLGFATSPYGRMTASPRIKTSIGPASDATKEPVPNRAAPMPGDPMGPEEFN